MIDNALDVVKSAAMPNVIHTLVAVERPTMPLKRNTVRRFRQLDGKLVHQYFAAKGFPQTFNTDGENWWKVVTAIKRRDGHVSVFA